MIKRAREWKEAQIPADMKTQISTDDNSRLNLRKSAVKSAFILALSLVEVCEK